MLATTNALSSIARHLFMSGRGVDGGFGENDQAQLQSNPDASAPLTRIKSEEIVDHLAPVSQRTRNAARTTTRVIKSDSSIDAVMTNLRARAFSRVKSGATPEGTVLTRSSLENVKWEDLVDNKPPLNHVPEPFYAKDAVSEYELTLSTPRSDQNAPIDGEGVHRLVESGYLILHEERKRWNKQDLAAYEAYARRPNKPPYAAKWAHAPDSPYSVRMLAPGIRLMLDVSEPDNVKGTVDINSPRAKSDMLKAWVRWKKGVPISAPLGAVQSEPDHAPLHLAALDVGSVGPRPLVRNEDTLMARPTDHASGLQPAVVRRLRRQSTVIMDYQPVTDGRRKRRLQQREADDAADVHAERANKRRAVAQAVGR